MRIFLKAALSWLKTACPFNLLGDVEQYYISLKSSN